MEELLKEILQELIDIKTILKTNYEHTQDHQEEAEKARKQSEAMKMLLIEQFKKMSPQMGETIENLFPKKGG